MIELNLLSDRKCISRVKIKPVFERRRIWYRIWKIFLYFLYFNNLICIRRLLKSDF